MEIDKLPDDTILEILSFLTKGELLKIILVSKNHCVSQLSVHDRVWKQLYHREAQNPVIEVYLTRNDEEAQKFKDLNEQGEKYFSMCKKLWEMCWKDFLKYEYRYTDTMSSNGTADEFVTNEVHKKRDKKTWRSWGQNAKRFQDNYIKTTIVGDVSVGKTCLLQTAFSGEFPHEYTPSVFGNYAVSAKVADKIVNIAPFDSAGQVDYDFLRLLSYPDINSFRNVEVFYREVRGYPRTLSTKVHEKTHKLKIRDLSKWDHSIPVLLVGGKIDLRDELRKNGGEFVTTKQGIKLAKKLKCVSYLEVSALKDINVKNFFDIVAYLAFTQEITGKTTGNTVDKNSKKQCLLQ